MDFIRRNSPVFIIGFATVALFIVLIFLAQKQGGTSGPSLEKISEEELISEHTYTTGNLDAKVVIVEFSDFQCPACRQMAPFVNEIAEKYSEEVLIAYRHFPLPQHQDAFLAAVAAQAAGQEGKFWEYAEMLFDNQESLKREDLISYAETVGIERTRFEEVLNDPKFEQQVSEDIALGTRLNVSGTPTFIINDRVLQYRSIEEFRNQIIEEIRKFNPNVSDTLDPTIQQASADTSESTSSQEPVNYEQQLFDQKYGTIEIEYTTGGFIPSNVKAVQNQLVRWTNKTASEIELQQLINLYPEFDKPVIIQPNGTFELRMSQEKLWNFKEKTQRHYGSIFVVQP